jgi:hypothetical protein
MSAPLPDDRLEAELRAMLRRRAQDVDPRPPEWRDLAQRNGAVVISLRTGTPVDPPTGRTRRGPSRQWFRPVLAAAVALIVAMVGALVVRGGGPSSTADGPDPIDVPAAGQVDFDPAVATPLFPSTDDSTASIPPVDYVTDAKLTAEEYLRVVARFPVGEDWMVVDEPSKRASFPDDGRPPIQTATVAWSLRAEHRADLPPLAEGTVYLRNAERGARDTWLVVGVRTRTLQLDDIHRDGDELEFTVDRSSETETFMNDPAVVTVDGIEVARLAYREARRISLPHPAGAVAVIQVQHLIDGEWWSITSTAVPALDGAPTELPADVVPTTVASTPPSTAPATVVGAGVAGGTMVAGGGAVVPVTQP